MGRGQSPHLAPCGTNKQAGSWEDAIWGGAGAHSATRRGVGRITRTGSFQKSLSGSPTQDSGRTKCLERTTGSRNSCKFFRSTWSTWSAVINLTSRTGELRSAPSWPDARSVGIGLRAREPESPSPGGARSQGHNTSPRDSSVYRVTP